VESRPQHLLVLLPQVATAMPAAMIFVPSIGGVSHDFE
jgi:hypothetical protein